MLKTIASTLLFCLFATGFAGPAAARVAFSRFSAADADLAETASRHFSRALGRRVLPGSDFEPLLGEESERRPWLDLEPESLFPWLARGSRARWWVSGSLEEDGEELVFRYWAMETATGRRRVFIKRLPAQPAPAPFRDAALETAGYMRRREALGVDATDRNSIVEILRRRHGRQARGSVAIAINGLAGEGHYHPDHSGPPEGESRPDRTVKPDTLSGQALAYYLGGNGHPVLDGEADLLRSYASSHFRSGPWTFPATLTAEHFLIGLSRLEPTGEIVPGLVGVEAHLEIKLLDFRGTVIASHDIRTWAPGLSPRAAAARALDAAAAESLLFFGPLRVSRACR